MRYIVIMAGGSGTRLWPLSRRDMPKQLLNLFQGTSLLRMAYQRIIGLVPDQRILVCTGMDYLGVVAETLPELPADNLFGEPIGRDSLNAVAWPTAVLAQRDPQAVVAMISADHLIQPVDAYRAALDKAFAVAESNAQALVTLGVVPTSPHTGFGYLHRGEPVPGFSDTCRLRSFKEKPDSATARAYLDSGDYWWNAGMFVFRAATMLQQLEILVPQGFSLVSELVRHPDRLAEIYPQLPKISIDYAVLEPVAAGRGSAHVVAVGLPISWHDVGGFATLHDQLATDEQGNSVQGLAVAVDCHNNLVINSDSGGKLVAILGLSDMVVVQTEEITLICPLTESERIKELVARVIERRGQRYA